MTPFEKEALKWLQGVGVAVASAIVQYLSAAHPSLWGMSAAHPSLWGTIGLVVLTRVAGYGVSKVGAP